VTNEMTCGVPNCIIHRSEKPEPSSGELGVNRRMFYHEWFTATGLFLLR
jgi:hypothetical protein